MRIRFSYGKQGLELDLPEDRNVQVLRARTIPPLPNVDHAVREAIEHTIESPPLAEMARGRRNACIVISDITRPIPNREMLPAILQTLEASGVPRGRITILIATGIHRPNEGDELVHLVGPEIARDFRCVNHFSQREGECRLIGEVRGMPIWINQKYLDADLKILTGLVEPHFWAGFSGGFKAILPGIASIETMRHMHGMEMIDACMANCGILDGNVFHETGLQVAGLAGADFIVNVTVDEAKRPTGIFTGDVKAAHHAAAKLCERATAFQLDEPADLVIASNGGFPLDLTFYQAAKAMTIAWMLLKESGQSLIVAECAEGVGSAHYRALLDEAESPRHLLDLLARPGFFRPDQWNAQVSARILLENRVGVHAAGVPESRLRHYGFEPVSDPQAWLDRRLAELPRDARIIAIPDGPYVYGRVAQRVGV